MPFLALLPRWAAAVALLLILSPAWATGPLSPSLGEIEAGLEALPAARIFIAKRILTMDRFRTSGEAVAVIGDRILAVGSLDDLKHAAGDQVFAVDETFKDKVLIPGLIDHHLQPILAALALGTEVIAIEDWSLPDGVRPGVRDAEGYRRRLAEADARLADPKAPLVTWGFHPAYHGPLTRSDLDALNATRPILVWHRSSRELILNGAAIERFQITADFVSRQSPSAQAQSDLATGRFWEQGLLGVLPLLRPVLGAPERLLRGLAMVEDSLHASGVTTVAELGIGPSRPLIDALTSVMGDDATPFRVYLVPDGRALAAQSPAEPRRQLAVAAEMAGWGSGKVAVLRNQIGLAVDGGPWSGLMRLEARPAATPGDAEQPEPLGAWSLDPETFARIFETYWDAGYQIHAHVGGDAALELVLDNLERQMRRHPRYDHRTTVLPVAVASEEQLRRLARLGVVVSASPYAVSALSDLYARSGLDQARADALMPLGAARRAGLPVALHSDLPMAPAQPLALVSAAVNRLTLTGRVAGPEQRLGVEDALAAVTINAAYALRLDNEIGSIEPGKLANFTVLESDPLAVPPAQLATVGVWGTVLEGRVQPVTRPNLPARTAAFGIGEFGLDGQPRLSGALAIQVTPGRHPAGPGRLIPLAMGGPD
jgi:predicted amidohydrolase YtcJ